MALTETPPLPYELLFRFDEVTGDLKGAHFVTITTVLRDGVAIAATPSEPMAVSLAKGAAGLDLAPILGQLATAQAQVIDQHEATIAAHEADLKAKDANIQALLEERDRLRIIVDAFPSENPDPGSAAEPSPEAPAT